MCLEELRKVIRRLRVCSTDYVFGSAEKDARHWDVLVNDIFQNADDVEVLASLFDAGVGN